MVSMSTARQVNLKYSDDQIRNLGCLICGAPATLHHIRKLATSKKRSNSPRIPLCVFHHTGGDYGFSVHAGEKIFEYKYGNMLSLIIKTNVLLEKIK